MSAPSRSIYLRRRHAKSSKWLAKVGPEHYRDESDDADAEAVPEELYYILDHDYTNANLSLNGLKSRDLVVAHTLKDMCADKTCEGSGMVSAATFLLLQNRLLRVHRFRLAKMKAML